jgi:cation-transporting ATPase 13A2
MLKE